MSTANFTTARPTRRVGLIHTVAGLRPVFGELTARLLPDVAVIDLVDETLLADAIAAGGLTEDIQQRLAARVQSLAAQGVDAVLVTCSSLGPAVDRLAATSSLPLLRVDTAMADQAVRSAARIGVLATLPTTMNPTVELIRDRAAGTQVEVVAHLCEGAFAALKANDVARHDELVLAGLRALEPRVDIVVLAQASMARALTDGGAPGRVPILTSPPLAAQQLARLVAER